MKIHYKLFLSILPISLCFLSNIQAAPTDSESKLFIADQEWDKKVAELRENQAIPDDPQVMQESRADVLPMESGQFLEHHPAPATLPNVFQGKITMKGENVPLNFALRSIASATGHNIIYGPDVNVRQAVSMDINDIEIWRALNTILFSTSYGFKVNNKDLVILSSETRVFRIALPPVSQSFSDSTSNESFVTSGSESDSTDNQGTSQEVRVGTKILVESSLDKLSFWDDIVKNLQSLLSQSAKYSVNKTAGVIVATDLPSNLDRIGSYINEVNFKISQQIEVDVRVVEVSLTDERKMGVDWNALANNLKGINNLSFATNFATNNFTSGDFVTFSAAGDEADSGTVSSGVSSIIKALDSYGNVEIVSQPRIMLLNNIPAVLQVGTTKAFVDSSQIETTQTGTTTSLSTSQVQSGVTMRLMGSVMGDEIYLSVTPSVTTIDDIRSVTSGTTTIEAPQTTTKSLNTMVKVRANDTVAIGGLITSNNSNIRNEVPGLSKIPLIGKLFGYSGKKNNKTELIIFITPKRS